MAERLGMRVGVVVVAAVAVWALAPVAGQAPAGVARPWTTPRTADGQPDLQGNWTNATITPIDRPQGAPPVYTEQQVRRMEKGYADRVERLAQPSDPNRTAPPQGGDGSTGAAGNVGGYNNFWIDPGDRVAVVNGEYRSSLIVDPPSGRPPESVRSGQGPGGGAGRAAAHARRRVRSPRVPAARRALPDVVRLERGAADAAQLLLQQQLPDRADARTTS